MTSKHNKNLYLYILSLIPIIVTTPPYLGCCIIMILLLNFTMILGTTFRFFVNKINSGNTEKILTLALLIFITIIFKRLLVLFSPVLGIMLSFSIYFVPVSSLCLEHLYSKDDYSSSKVFGQNMKKSGLFSLYLFLFFLFREIIAFGSISIPVVKGIKLLKFLPWSTNFWATIPGTFIILGVILSLILVIDKRFDVVRKSKKGV